MEQQGSCGAEGGGGLEGPGWSREGPGWSREGPGWSSREAAGERAAAGAAEARESGVFSVHSGQ